MFVLNHTCAQHCDSFLRNDSNHFFFKRHLNVQNVSALHRVAKHFIVKLSVCPQQFINSLVQAMGGQCTPCVADLKFNGLNPANPYM